MSIKPPELLNRIPSVAELLEKPQIRALVERWNQSAVAGSVKSFLEELGNDLQRRAAEVNFPSIRELADRAARYVASQQHQELGVAINATGRLWDAPWSSTPLAEAALDRTYASAGEFTVAPAKGDGVTSQAAAILCKLTGAQSAAVVHTYSGALWLALASLAAEREVLIARAEVGDIGPNDSLPKLAAAAGSILTEVGTTNSAPVAAYESAASPRTAAILTASSDTYRVVGQTVAAELEELIAVAHSRQLTMIAALGAAPLTAAAEACPARTAAGGIEAGADVVILRGDGFAGGPPSGIILGRKQTIDRIKSHPLFAAWNLDAIRTASLVATLGCYENPTNGLAQIPVWQCLTVSVDNLRNRAERLAPQLAAAEGIASATAVETRSPLMATIPDGLPSVGVALTPADGDVAALDTRLRSARFPIFGRVANGQLVLDLRTVPPRHDTTLVETITGTSPAPVAP